MGQPKSKRAKVVKSSRPASNSDDFKSVARRLECDEDKGRFEKKLGKIARVKPPLQK